MHNLHNEICDFIEDHDYFTFKKVADFIHCTKQEMSNFHTNGQLSFRKFLRLSFLLHPQKQKEIMDGWCLRFNSTESIKQSFEYASITRNKELLKKLIDKYKDDKALSKYVLIYTILYDFYINKIGAKDLISRLDKIGQLKGEIAILADIIKCYNYYYVEKYHLMLETAKEAERQINKLSDRQMFIKECFLHRIAEVLGNVSLYLNDKEAARYYSFLIINANICAKTVSDAFYLLGMTYLTEDKLKCIEYLRTRYEISKGVGDADIEENARRDLDFAKLYLDVKLEKDSDAILIKLQENKGSEFELKLIKEAIFKQGDDDFLTLLGAMAHNSIIKLHECRKHFDSKMNYFFRSLAAIEIQKHGDDHVLIEEIINFKIETKGDVQFEEDYIKCFSSCGFGRSAVGA